MLTGWKKISAIIFFAVIFFGMSFFSASALETDTYSDRELYEAIGLPEEITNLLGEDGGDVSQAVDRMDTGYFFGIIADAINLCFGGVLKSTALMIGAVVMSALVNAYCRGDGLSPALGKTAGLVSVMCFGLTYYAAAKTAWDSVIGAVNAMTLLMSGLLPGVIASCAASGRVTLSAVSSAGITLLLVLLERLCSDLLLPFLNVCFALSLANGLSDGEFVDLSGIGAFVKNTFMILMGVLMAVFCVSVVYRTNLAYSADSVLLRSVRFASGSFIPIVGGALSEASVAVVGGLDAIRRNVGTAAAAALTVAALPKLTELVLFRLAFYFCGGSARLLGCKRDGFFINELGSLISSGIVTVICCGVMLLLSLALVSGG